MRKHIDFCYKATRTYVHGTDIFNAVLAFFQSQRIKSFSNIEMNIHQIIRNNLTLVVDERLMPSEKASVMVSFEGDDVFTEVALIENDTKISCSYDYHEENIIKAADLDNEKKSIILVNYDQYTFVERIVALNKGLLRSLFPQVTGKWYFTKIRLDNIDFNKQELYEVALLFKRNFNFKLTRSDILINNKLVGNIYFSLV